MGDTFTSNVVDNNSEQIAGINFHKGPMDFSVQYAVPNKQDSMLKNETTYTSIQVARRGKFAITGESVETIDVPHSVVAKDWEDRNDKAITIPRSKGGSSNYLRLSVDIPADFVIGNADNSEVTYGMAVKSATLVGNVLTQDLNPYDFNATVHYYEAYKVESDVAKVFTYAAIINGEEQEQLPIPFLDDEPPYFANSISEEGAAYIEENFPDGITYHFYGYAEDGDTEPVVEATYTLKYVFEEPSVI